MIKNFTDPVPFFSAEDVIGALKKFVPGVNLQLRESLLAEIDKRIVYNFLLVF